MYVHSIAGFQDDFLDYRWQSLEAFTGFSEGRKVFFGMFPPPDERTVALLHVHFAA